MSHEIFEDIPKLLGHAHARAARRAELHKLHVAPLVEFARGSGVRSKHWTFRRSENEPAAIIVNE